MCRATRPPHGHPSSSSRHGPRRRGPPRHRRRRGRRPATSRLADRLNGGFYTSDDWLAVEKPHQLGQLGRFGHQTWD